MDDYLKILRFDLAKKLNKEMQYIISGTLKKLDGVSILKMSSNFLVIEYNPHIISKSKIKQSIIEIGFDEKLNPNQLGFFKGWIQKLADSNKKNLSNQKMDCCNLNH